MELLGSHCNDSHEILYFGIFRKFFRNIQFSLKPKASNTHAEYVVFFAFPLQQWLHERASMLRYAYIACLVLNKVIDDNVVIN
jgi:hypothetical protein